MKKKYYYNGPVFRFGRDYIGDWKATTVTVSSARARANLEYRYKAPSTYKLMGREIYLSLYQRLSHSILCPC